MTAKLNRLSGSFTLICRFVEQLNGRIFVNYQIATTSRRCAQGPMQDSLPRLIHYVTLHPESVLQGRAGQVNEAVGQLVIDRRLVRYGGDFGVGQRRPLSSCAALVQGIGPGVQVFVAGCHAVNLAQGDADAKGVVQGTSQVSDGGRRIGLCHTPGKPMWWAVVDSNH